MHYRYTLSSEMNNQTKIKYCDVRMRLTFVDSHINLKPSLRKISSNFSYSTSSVTWLDVVKNHAIAALHEDVWTVALDVAQTFIT